MCFIRAAFAMAGGKRKQKRVATSSRSENEATEVSFCGTCAKTLDDDPIGCDKCETWVHGSEMCSGLPKDVIDVILGYSGEGINYVCMNCRVLRASGATGSPSVKADNFMAETLAQLFQQMRGMCAVLTDLAAQVHTMSSQPPTSPPPPPGRTHADPTAQGLHRSSDTHRQHLAQSDNPPSTGSGGYRLVVRQELKELQEREKRKDSIIVRGVEAASPDDFVAKFSELTQHSMGMRVELTDVRAIPSHPDLYRAKILNINDRKLLLDRAKNLRGTRYDKVFIRRDLTYAQRAELRERRLNRQSQQQVSAETIPKAVETVHAREEQPHEQAPRPRSCESRPELAQEN